MKFDGIFELANVILYLVHVAVFSILGYRQGKRGGTKSIFIILIFLFVLFLVSLQISGLIAELIFILLKIEMTSELKPIHDTVVLVVTTLIELPIWIIFLKRKAG